MISSLNILPALFSGGRGWHWGILGGLGPLDSHDIRQQLLSQLEKHRELGSKSTTGNEPSVELRPTSLKIIEMGNLPGKMGTNLVKSFKVYSQLNSGMTGIAGGPFF